MASDFGQLSNSFKQASSYTDALLAHLAKSKQESLDLADDSSAPLDTARRDDAVIISHCIQIVNVMQKQQELIGQQKDIIIKLEKRLAAVEAEFAPQRPLPGKTPLDPKGPKS